MTNLTPAQITALKWLPREGNKLPAPFDETGLYGLAAKRLAEKTIEFNPSSRSFYAARGLTASGVVAKRLIEEDKCVTNFY